MVLITRPGAPGQRLAQCLQELGQPAVWWPAFDLLPPADPRQVINRLANLHAYDLVVFVSPMAVQALAGFRADVPWPRETRIAAVGAATLRAVGAQWPLDPGVTVIGPPGPDTADGGAETLWPLIAALPSAPRQVLIVRAQSGRDWLGEKLRASGAQVEEIEVYQRLAHMPTPQEQAALHDALSGDPAAAVLFSSSEAVGVLTRSLGGEGLGPQRPGAVALCVHERVAQAARAAGWSDVRVCEAQPAAIMATLAAGAGQASGRGPAPFAGAGKPGPAPAPGPDSVA